MTTLNIILITIIIILIASVIWLETQLSRAHAESKDHRFSAERFENRWNEAKNLYYEERDKHYAYVCELMETRLSKEESLQIKNENGILNERYNKLMKENEHLKAELDSADYMLERYRQYFIDAKKLGYKYKTSSKELSGRPPISYPDFIKEENPDG